MESTEMDKKIAELKSLAMNADLRGWKGLSLARPSTDRGAVDDNWHVVNDNDTMSTHCFDFCHSTSANSESVARFIAAASPELVVCLIEALAAETCKADKYRTQLEKHDEVALVAKQFTEKKEIFITRKLLTKLIGCRFDTIDRMVAKGELPKPIKLGVNGRYRFIKAEIIPALMKHDIDIERLAIAHGVDLNHPDAEAKGD
ncbi:helix-turn-helix transcriptional regulator [Aeromonas salmonicida]|uniref:helix-turn-helix transcriptional regulator n=2 Tax=Aeromonas salmonicida TaxID=645 RepID=UPI000B1B8946|nr:hypothetical protein [Aeromonas salmonicida]